MSDLSPQIIDSINDQIRAEIESAYLYLSMSTCLESQDLRGMAHWMQKQVEEEWEHAMRFLKYLQTRNARVVLKTIASPEGHFDGPLEIFRAALGHEREISERIRKMADLAFSEKDYMTASMLKWFIDEQVEEEASVGEIVKKLEFLGSARSPGLYFLDRELGQR